MKYLGLLIFFLLFSGLVRCDKEEAIDPENITVERYLNLLSADKYDEEMPALSPSDIPALIEYRDDIRIITKYPRNPISSFYNPEIKLGIFVLWTIESIRAVEIESEYLVMRYPSLNPFFVTRNGGLLEPKDAIAHKTAADAYYNWW